MANDTVAPPPLELMRLPRGHRVAMLLGIGEREVMVEIPFDFWIRRADAPQKGYVLRNRAHAALIRLNPVAVERLRDADLQQLAQRGVVDALKRIEAASKSGGV
jgi:hypothetical protein